MSEKFAPMLAPNEKTDLRAIQYPLLASYKYDGIRCLHKNGQMMTRSLKKVPSVTLNKKFSTITEYSRVNQCILDGEIYAPGVPFQLIQSCVMTIDYSTKAAQKKWLELCDDLKINVTREEVVEKLKFYCFDFVSLSPETLGSGFDAPFKLRIEHIEEALKSQLCQHLIAVDNWSVFSAEGVEALFENALGNGFEGLILRDPKGYYKCNRGTIKEGLIFKVKPFETFDAVVIGIIQATEVDPNAEKTVNELGRSVTSKKKDDRIPVEKASAFLVKYNGMDLKIPLGKHTDTQKEYIWKHQSEFIGRTIEYKAMMIGSKDLPRIPGFYRYRDDK